MMANVMDLRQLDELLDDLEILAKSDQRRVMNVATRRGAVVLASKVRKAARSRTGKLRRNIVAMNMRKRGDQSGAAAVFVRTEGKANNPNNAFYWYFLEMGTSKMAPVPFIRPAFQSGIAEAQEEILAAAEKQLMKALRK